jgi:hypothetical protein
MFQQLSFMFYNAQYQNVLFKKTNLCSLNAEIKKITKLITNKPNGTQKQG